MREHDDTLRVLRNYQVPDHRDRPSSHLDLLVTQRRIVGADRGDCTETVARG
jgi:hypothetical protein